MRRGARECVKKEWISYSVVLDNERTAVSGKSICPKPSREELVEEARSVLEKNFQKRRKQREPHQERELLYFSLLRKEFPPMGNRVELAAFSFPLGIGSRAREHPPPTRVGEQGEAEQNKPAAVFLESSGRL